MTETTDIEALRRRSNNLRTADQTDAFIDLLLDKLEAERQRAAGSEEELHKALHREKAAERKLLAAKEEIAALKAKLANPVVLTDCTFEAVSHMAHWYSEGECVAWGSGAEHVKKQILEAGFTVKEE